MSVINQMLRDLDRQAALAGSAASPAKALGDLTFGTRSVLVSADKPRLWRSCWRRVGALSSLAVFVGGGIWFEGMPPTASPAASIVSAAAPPLISPLLVIAEPTVLAPLIATDVPPKAEPVPKRLPVVASLPPRGLAQPLLTAEASRPPMAAQWPQSLPTPSSEQAVLAQAQSMWRSGMQLAALELLNQAVAAAEREVPGWSTVERSERLATLVRELARMQLSMGQAGLAMDLLIRLAPTLSGYPDIWAIRGNVAQRLGQYQASIDAYAMALKVRPDEPRWLLGSAVSHATLGQLKEATEMAEKARDQGWVSPEATDYLVQLGVTLLAR